MLINNQPINPFNEISDKILNAVLCYQLTHTYTVQCGMYQPIKRLTNNKNDKTTTTYIATLALSFDILTSIGEIFKFDGNRPWYFVLKIHKMTLESYSLYQYYITFSK